MGGWLYRFSTRVVGAGWCDQRGCASGAPRPLSACLCGPAGVHMVLRGPHTPSAPLWEPRCSWLGFTPVNSYYKVKGKICAWNRPWAFPTNVPKCRVGFTCRVGFICRVWFTQNWDPSSVVPPPSCPRWSPWLKPLLVACKVVIFHQALPSEVGTVHGSRPP